MSKARRNRRLRNLARELVDEAPEYAERLSNGLGVKAVARSMRQRRARRR